MPPTHPRKSWLITDTHFNHAMLVDRYYRPRDYEQQILSNWQARVAEWDTVYHLGDVIMSRASELPGILALLPGQKILIRGNHDHSKPSWYLNAGFDMVCDGLLVGGAWLTHAPQATLPDGAVINIHGHLHGNDHRLMGMDYPPREFCRQLALELHGYGPVDMDEFVGLSQSARMILGAE